VPNQDTQGFSEAFSSVTGIGRCMLIQSIASTHPAARIPPAEAPGSSPWRSRPACLRHTHSLMFNQYLHAGSRLLIRPPLGGPSPRVRVCVVRESRNDATLPPPAPRGAERAENRGFGKRCHVSDVNQARPAPQEVLDLASGFWGTKSRNRPSLMAKQALTCPQHSYLDRRQKNANAAPLDSCHHKRSAGAHAA